MNYEVSIVNEPFMIGEGLISDKTVNVTFLGVNGDIEEKKLFGFLDHETIIKLRIADDPRLMKALYFKDFTIQKYHELFEWDDPRTIRRFIADSCFFDGDSDFNGLKFGNGGFSLAHSYFGNGEVDFQNAVFLSDTIDMSGINFGVGNKNFASTRFNGKIVNFFSTKFGDGNINFKCSSFINAALNFSGAIFGDGDVDFDFSVFGIHGVDFCAVNFGIGQISFRSAHFNGGKILFFGSRFGAGKVTFSDAILGDGNVDFSYCHFEHCVIHFKYTILGSGHFNMNNIKVSDGYVQFKALEFKNKRVTFVDSEIDQMFFVNCLFKEHVNLSVHWCNVLAIENCINEKTIDMIASKKKMVRIGCLNIINTKNLGQIYLDWSLNDVKGMIYSQGKTTTYLDKAYQFRLLKENFHTIGHYVDEDLSYVEFKRCKEISELKGEDLVILKHKLVKIIWRHLIFPVKWFVLDFIGNYATNPFRILASTILTIIFFTLIYSMPFVQLNGGKEYLETILNPSFQIYAKSLYHSVATIFTIGYGNVYPGNFITMVISGIEGFTGIFLMSYFTVAFMRKVLR